MLRCCSRLLATMTVVLMSMSTLPAHAIELIPPNDVTGYIQGGHQYAEGRGVVFKPNQDVWLDAFSFAVQAEGSVNYKIAQVVSGAFYSADGENVLVSGSLEASGSDLQWLMFDPTDVLLQAGSYYHILVTIAGQSNSCQLYRNYNVRFGTSMFDEIDGTFGNSVDNLYMPAVRLHEKEDPPVTPEPATLVLIGLGIAGISSTRRKMLSRRSEA